MARRLAIRFFLLLGLASLQGCASFLVALGSGELNFGSEEQAPFGYEPVAVAGLAIYPAPDERYAVSVRYADGVVRRTEWGPLDEPAVWATDGEGGLVHDVEAPEAFLAVERLAARGAWPRVVERLDALLRYSGDRILEVDGRPVYVRDEARRRLLALPPEGRAVYALTHADAARELFEEARGRADTELLERLLAEHPADDLVPAARRVLIGRLVEAGRIDEAIEHLACALAGADRAQAERLHRQRVALQRARTRARARGPAPAQTEPSGVGRWAPIAEAPGWPRGPGVCVDPAGTRGLVLRGEVLVLYGEDGRARAQLDLRRQAPRERPLCLAERGSRAVRSVLWWLLLPAAVAWDLGTLPLQLAVVLVWAGAS